MPKVLSISYICVNCGNEKPEWNDSMICHICRGDLKGNGFPTVTGTRDQFGIGKNFIHENDDGSKKEITTWREWEKAGYKDAVSFHKGQVKEKIKEKMDKIRRKEGKKITIGV